MKRMQKFYSWLLVLALCCAYSSALADDSEWTCESCGTVNSTEFCLHCGFKKPEGIVCPTCGTVYPSDTEALFCGNCGTKLTEENTASVDQPSSKDNTEIEIPAEAVIYNGHSYYVFHDEIVSWDGAQAYCESKGGHLATITDKEENEFIYSYIVSKGLRSAYFGLSDPQSINNWQWVTGEPVKYTNWHEGEPNSDVENYAMYYYGFTDETWNDGMVEGTVDTERNFICEWEQTIPSDMRTDQLPVSTPYPEQIESGNTQSANVGKIVQFGSYEQDGDRSNGKEPIEWYVLDEDEQGVLLISVYILDAKPFNTKNTAVNWTKSSLRTWLNKTFFNSAFSREEKRHIINSHVLPAKDMSSDVETILDQGKETIDKIFLMSRDEFQEKYSDLFIEGKMGISKENEGKIPYYAPQTAQTLKNTHGFEQDEWWLRGEVYDKRSDYPYAAMACSVVGPSVSIPVTGTTIGVRPLIRIDSIDSSNQEPVSSPISYFPTPTPPPAPMLDSPSSITESDIGSTVKFGNYEQDDDPVGLKEPIEWIILDVRDNKALLISKYGLDAKPFNTTYADVNWEQCSLRTWLNKDFFETAFNEQEQACIVLSEIDNSWRQAATGDSHPTAKESRKTEDKVFLLSIREALVDYKTILQLNPCESTEYARAQGAYTENGYFNWKLRTPDPEEFYGLFAIEDWEGRLYTTFTERSDDVSGAIRPVIWIDLSLVP